MLRSWKNCSKIVWAPSSEYFSGHLLLTSQKLQVPVPCCFTKFYNESSWGTAISGLWKTNLEIHLLHCFIEYHCMLSWSMLLATITPTNMSGKKWAITLLLGKKSLPGIYGFSYLVDTNLKTKVCLQCKQGDNLAKGYKTHVLTIKMWLSILSLCYVSGTWAMLYQLNRKQSSERDQKIAWEEN